MDGLRLNNIVSIDYEIFPNPCNDVLLIEGLKEEMEVLEIFDVRGRRFTALVEFNLNSENQVVVNVAELPNGRYILKTVSNTFHFIKQ